MAEEFIKSLEALQQIRRKQDYSFTRLGRLSEAYRLNQSAGTLSESVSASVVLAAQHAFSLGVEEILALDDALAHVNTLLSRPEVKPHQVKSSTVSNTRSHNDSMTSPSLYPAPSGLVESADAMSDSQNGSTAGSSTSMSPNRMPAHSPETIARKPSSSSSSSSSSSFSSHNTSAASNSTSSGFGYGYTGTSSERIAIAQSKAASSLSSSSSSSSAATGPASSSSAALSSFSSPSLSTASAQKSVSSSAASSLSSASTTGSSPTSSTSSSPSPSSSSSSSSSTQSPRSPPSLLSVLNPASVKKGDVWSHDGVLLPVGTEVVALVDVDSAMWIFASVAGVRPRHPNRPQFYEVYDEDAGDAAPGAPQGKKKKYALSADRIRVLPSLEDFPVSKRQEVPAGTEVLAMFPEDGVTAFYKATVIASAKKRRSNYYLLCFDDDNDEERDVSARFVVPLPANFYNNNG